MIVDHVAVRQLAFALKTPYRLSSGDLHLFDPVVMELRDTDGRCGFGEALIVPGYTHESVESTWRVACMLGERLVGLDLAAARQAALECLVPNPGVASATLAAVDMLAGEPLLCVKHDVRVPLLAPCQAHEPAGIRDEVDRLLAEGFRTLKVKVGYRWTDDLERVGLVQKAADGRATLRLDANRGFSLADGKAFASRLDPRDIELLEQPCAAEDWASNAAVAAVSKVPVMLDESIYGSEDVERAATLANVGFVKLKLKKIGSSAMLRNALDRIRALGMTPVMGDGVSIEIGCWMEACVAVHTLDNAGEMNGFLKVRDRLFANPLEFKDGAIGIPAGYWPEVDQDALIRHTQRSSRYSVRSFAL